MSPIVWWTTKSVGFNFSDSLNEMCIRDSYTTSAGQLTLTTPANRFRVEYYAPYEVAEEALSLIHI